MLVLAGLIYLGITGDRMFGPSEIYNVTSNNQQGGITAGKIENVNIGKTERKLTDDFKNKLLITLVPYKEKTITLNAMMGDMEAINYANSIRDFLNSEGYNTTDDKTIHYLMVSSRQYDPIEFHVTKEGNIDIFIGPQK